MYWEIHTDENCKTCFSIAEKISKGGRPRKIKRGRKPDNELKSAQTTTDKPLSVLEAMKTKILSISKSLEPNGPANFKGNFYFKETVNGDLFRPICKDILDMPLETSCEHYFCTTCLSKALEATQAVACPVCKVELDDQKIKPATRRVLWLTGELKIACNKCNSELNYEDSGHHNCLPRHPLVPGIAQAAQPLLAPAVVPPVQPAVPTLQDAFEQIRQGNMSPEV